MTRSAMLHPMLGFVVELDGEGNQSLRKQNGERERGSHSLIIKVPRSGQIKTLKIMGKFIVPTI